MVIRGVDETKRIYPILVDTGGRLIVVLRAADDPIRKYVDLTGTDETLVWAPEAGKKFVITDIVLSATAISAVTFRDGLEGDTILEVKVLAGCTVPMNFLTPLVSAVAENYLTGQTTAATVCITVSGYEV